MKPVDLVEHPEGGRFREVFRSGDEVTTADGRQRAGLTHIYFSLAAGEVSRFHRVESDEVWNLYRGEGLWLFVWDGTEAPPSKIELSAAQNRYCHVVQAGMWQAAQPLGEEVLVGCSVAPGLAFEDFTLIDAAQTEAALLVAIAPDLRHLC